MKPLKFRELAENECRILLMRHGEHRNNILTIIGEQICKDVGRKISEQLAMDACYASPAKRTVATAWHVKTKPGIPVVKEDRLADLTVQNLWLVEKIEAEAEELGLKGSEGFAKIIFQSEEYKKIFQKRAEESKKLLLEIAKKHAGKNVLAVSHGLSRIEITIQALRGEKIHLPEKLFKTAEIVELIINSDTGKLIEVNYLN